MFTPVDLEIFGSLMKGIGIYQTGQNIDAAAEYEAKQYRQNANKAMAVATREAGEEIRQAKLVQSRILAVAAASGAGASDPTIVRLIGKQAGEGAYRAALDIYRGQELAGKYKAAAKAKEYEGGMAKYKGTVGAATSLANSGVSLYQKYGQGGPAPEPQVDPGNWWGDGGWID